MAEILCESQDDVIILRVIGGATFAEISDAVKLHFPKVTKHLIWDYTNGSLVNVTSDDFRRVPDLSAKYFSNRSLGRTAFACPCDGTYGMFRMYIVFADFKNMPYEYGVHRNFEDAFKWVTAESPIFTRYL